MWDCVLEFIQSKKEKGWWKTSPLLLCWPGCFSALYLMEQSVQCCCKHQWKQQEWKIFSNDRGPKLTLQLKSFWLLGCKHDFIVSSTLYLMVHLMKKVELDLWAGSFPAWKVEQSVLAEHDSLSSEIRCLLAHRLPESCACSLQTLQWAQRPIVGQTPPGWSDLI